MSECKQEKENRDGADEDSGPEIPSRFCPSVSGSTIFKRRQMNGWNSHFVTDLQRKRVSSHKEVSQPKSCPLEPKLSPSSSAAEFYSCGLVSNNVEDEKKNSRTDSGENISNACITSRMNCMQHSEKHTAKQSRETLA